MTNYTTPTEQGLLVTISADDAERISDAEWRTTQSLADSTAGALRRLRSQVKRYYSLFRTPDGHVFIAGIEECKGRPERIPSEGDIVRDRDGNAYVMHAHADEKGVVWPFVLPPVTKTVKSASKSSHADCDHANTKSARAKCRRERNAK